MAMNIFLILLCLIAAGLWTRSIMLLLMLSIGGWLEETGLFKLLPVINLVVYWSIASFEIWALF